MAAIRNSEANYTTRYQFHSDNSSKCHWCHLCFLICALCTWMAYTPLFSSPSSLQQLIFFSFEQQLLGVLAVRFNCTLNLTVIFSKLHGKNLYIWMLSCESHFARQMVRGKKGAELASWKRWKHYLVLFCQPRCMPFKCIYLFIKIYCFETFASSCSLCKRIRAVGIWMRVRACVAFGWMAAACGWFACARARALTRSSFHHPAEQWTHSNETILLNELEMIVVLNFVLHSALDYSLCSRRRYAVVIPMCFKTRNNFACIPTQQNTCYLYVM